MSTHQLLAYHGDPAIKANYLARVRAHAAADEIVKGKYWEDGKGCAIGCTLHSAQHAAYETELGIPQMLARLEDRIFEGLPNGEAKQFPEQFLSAIRVGSDLSRVGWQFLHWLLTDELAGRDHPLMRDAVRACADVLVPLTKGQPADKSAAENAARSAMSAAVSAVSAESATWSARSAMGAAMSAMNAAMSAAMSTMSAAESAARSATWSARSARSAARSAVWSAVWSAESAAWQRMRDELLRLLAAAPVRKEAV